MNSPRQDDSNHSYRHVWSGNPYKGIWQNARDQFGPPSDVVRANRRVARCHGEDILPGQLCFITEGVNLYEGVHAVRWKGRKTICAVWQAQEGLKLQWGSGSESAIVHPYEIDHLGAVVGLASGDHNPMFWLFGN